jgi:HK97 gp10 family phage protein
MASRGKLEIQGLQAVTKQLRKMDDETKKELKAVHKFAADIVYRNALPRVPVRSGRLKANMRTTASLRSGAVRVGSKRSVPYAGPIHFGWPNRPAPQRGWRGGPIRPNTFLYSALDSRKAQVEEAFARGVRKAAKRAGLSPE